MSTATSRQIALSEEEQTIEQPQEAVPVWKHQVAERLAAHRSRRNQNLDNHPELPLDLGPTVESADSRAARIAAAVAARYAQLPSYREILAAQAEAAARQAEAAAAAAKAAALSAEAASVAQQALLAGFDMLEEQESQEIEAAAAQSLHALSGSKDEGESQMGILIDSREPFHLTALGAATEIEAPVDEEIEIVDEVETYSTEPVEEPIPLSANLIEFPRQLIATRKARPRLAEGPLHDPEASAHDASQLRIFEVEPEMLSTQPLAEELAAFAAPEWTAIRLEDLDDSSEAVLMEEPEHDPALGVLLDLPLQTAPLELRLMASIVDACLVVAGFILFAVAFVASTAHPPAMKPALIGGAIALFAFFLLYQLLFFTFAEATPGMRYAHIALCTFDDQNPTRAAMRRRIAALLLSACPLGLGFAWAWFDNDRLSWHDRITRMYQRSY
ncbi:MAG: RDD family protein [Acidobacteriaceae bacterium]